MDIFSEVRDLRIEDTVAVSAFMKKLAGKDKALLFFWLAQFPEHEETFPGSDLATPKKIRCLIQAELARREDAAKWQLGLVPLISAMVSALVTGGLLLISRYLFG